MFKKRLFLLKGEKLPLFCRLKVLEMSQRNTIGLIIFSSFCSHSRLRMYFTVGSRFSGLYAKLQDYQDAFSAPLGITCHLYEGLFVSLIFSFLDNHMKEKLQKHQIASWSFLFWYLKTLYYIKVTFKNRLNINIRLWIQSIAIFSKNI